MFDNLNFWEIGALLLLALFIFGPERLPKVIGDGLRMLRGLREMARNATRDLSREMGTDISLEDLHPKTFIRKHLLSEEEEAQMRRPFEDAYQDVKQITTEANDGWSEPAPRPDDSGYGDGGTYRDRGPASRENGSVPRDNGYGDGGSGAYHDGSYRDGGSSSYRDGDSGSYGETGYGAGPYDSPSGAHPQHRNIDSDAT